MTDPTVPLPCNNNAPLTNKERQARWRAKKAAEGQTFVRVTISLKMLKDLEDAMEEKGFATKEAFITKCLATGIKFVGNSGTPKGRKLKGN